MAEKTGKILAIDDNEDILISLKLLLKQQVELIHTEQNPQRIPERLKEENYDVILLDMNFSSDMISGKEGFYWLQRILENDPDAVVIFITAFGDVEKAVRAVHAGATDFILKPWQNEKLLATIHSAVNLHRSKREASSLRERQQELNDVYDQPFHDFIGVSEEMRSVFSTIKKVAHTDASVLILGENGTGKELVARALHRNSKRRDNVFVSVDLGSISETLFESELFGHVKGAYTDAKKDRPGRFEIASGGTLFLDEIGNLSLPLQAKLLTVIEKGEVVRVGSNQHHPVNVRLVCATNTPVHQLARDKRFRQDLLYRINTIEIHLPPLRERIEDISLLASHFLQRLSKKYGKEVAGINKSAMKKLEMYHWPGNVRELQHAIERAIILTESNYLEPGDFLLSASSKGTEEFVIETYNLEEVEKKTIEKVIRKYKGNITQAARELGLTRTSLYRRLEKYGL